MTIEARAPEAVITLVASAREDAAAIRARWL
jgi:hypothetical protein